MPHEAHVDRNHEGLRRTGALLAAGALLGVAGTRRTPGSLAAAGLLAVPLAVRGLRGRWPLGGLSGRPEATVISTSLTIGRPPDEVYDAWRDLGSLPEKLRHLESVQVIDPARQRWVATTPAGTRIEWEAEITEERRGELLRWRVEEGSDLPHEGELELKPWRNGRGTMLSLRMKLVPVGGARRRLREAFLRPALTTQVREELRRFKSRLEAGEVPTNSPQAVGERALLTLRNPF